MTKKKSPPAVCAVLSRCSEKQELWDHGERCTVRLLWGGGLGGGLQVGRGSYNPHIEYKGRNKKRKENRKKNQKAGFVGR